jgi:histidinol dehydrogenase
MLANALAPEHLVVGIADNDAHIGPITIAVYHDYNQTIF